MGVLGPRFIHSLFLRSLWAPVLCGSVTAQTTQRVSVDSNGVQGNGTSYRQGQGPAFSADGRYVAFSSIATNLVPGDTNGSTDVFVRDLQSGAIERVNLDSGGVQATGGDSVCPSISADGRFVAFFGYASNLVPSDTNGFSDVFVRDRLNGTTERVSVDSAGQQQGPDSETASMSADGRFVAFYSRSSNLVPGDTNGFWDVFVRDRLNGTTERVSVASGGAQAVGGHSTAPSISADGRYVAFESYATNLFPPGASGPSGIFVRDLLSGTTEYVNVGVGGAPGGGNAFQPSISADGRYVAFYSEAANLVSGDSNGKDDIFVRDRDNGTTVRVSIDSGGVQGNGHSQRPSISSDGRYIAFESGATNLVLAGTNPAPDVFVHDRFGGVTTLVSVDSGGTQETSGDYACISPDGGLIAFQSAATNLIPGDTNGFLDVFVRNLGAGGTTQESSGVGGVPSNGDSFGPAVSPDGRFVAFESNATNLVAGDTNGRKDVFLKDRDAAATVRVSVDSTATQGNGHSAGPSVSADGRYVAYDSVATNLVPGDSNAVRDVFVRDVQTSATSRVSVDSTGAQANGMSANSSVSADGRYIAFDSVATNLVVGDTNGASDVFLRDVLTNTTTRVSVGSALAEGNGPSSRPSISSDGRYVAFESVATNLVPQDGNGASDIFVRDLQSGTTARVSVDSNGAEGNGASTNAAISGGGNDIAFQSVATNLVPGDTNLAVDTFARTGHSTGTTRRVSQDPNGTEGLGSSTDPTISVDGRFAAFASEASNLVSGDTNGVRDVLLSDRVDGTLRRVSVDSAGAQGTNASGAPAISADGRHIAFDSFASNLVPGDTNGFEDVFMRDEGMASAFQSFCYGDGSGSACPCANSGATGHGCENSSNTGGAILTATGEASVTDDTVQFTSSDEKPVALSIFLQGTQVISPTVYGDGLRCTGGTLKRLYTKIAVGGVVTGPETGDLSVTVRSAFLGTPIPLGATRTYQVYYRDSAAGFCPSPTGNTYNISSGVIVVWGS